jgi:hypothetical protein
MKKMLLIVLIAVFMSSFALAATTKCNINASLVSQDPYPAIQGDYVRLVFQLAGNGITDASCGKITVELIEDFPISFDPGVSNKIEAQSGIYAGDYGNTLIAPFKVRIDKYALMGDNPIKLRYSSGFSLGSYIEKEFNLNVQDIETDFEVSVKDYNSVTKVITFEILNVGKNDVESLVSEIPVQDNIEIKGSRRNIIGSLDSNDDTTFTFEATPKDGQISMILLYNDDAGVRRQVEKSVMFNSADFKGLVRDKSGTSKWIYLIILIVIIAVIYFWRRNRKKKLEHAKKFH